MSERFLVKFISDPVNRYKFQRIKLQLSVFRSGAAPNASSHIESQNG
jgi:hypothetical protein